MLISSASPPELNLVLCFPNRYFFDLSFIHLSCYVDIILFHIVFFAVGSLNHSAFLSCSFSLSSMLLQNCWNYISYTIHLLIDSFLSLDKILIFTLSLYLFSCAVFTWRCCFSSSITIFIPFFLYVTLPFKLLIFLSPPYHSSLVTL